ncbi:venom protease-like [Pararge aegeria]|uniref:venom protease-like n=1 Tax=Pararge aegeria TaxID=116150 RepID=UPI0019D1942F|nr:venom protease-like [Pararge aegeria]
MTMLFVLSIFFLIAVQDGSSLDQSNLAEGDRCVVKHTNTVGVCTPASTCQNTRNDYQINGIRPTFCSHNFDTILVCCTDNSNIFNTGGGWNYDRRPVWNNFGSANRNNMRLSEKKCEEYSRHVTQTVGFITLDVEPEKMTISAPKCDYNGVELIVGGENANQGEFPHMAALGWVDAVGNYVFQCGGSLISSRFVLTAAHCTHTPNKLLRDPKPQIVRLGDQNLNNNVRDNASPIEVPIKTIHKHPNYVSPYKYYDIALLELNADVDFEDNIRPACLWTKPDFTGYTKAIAIGWGVVDPQQPTKTSDELKKVSLSLLENHFCNVTLKDTFFRLWKGFSDEQLCAGELRGGQDTCQGDSGSPLQVASRANKCIFHVIGVTAFGRQCAKSGKPAVYTRVSSHLDWIEGLVWPGEQ